MKNSLVSLGGLSPIQKHGAEVYQELCSSGADFCIFSNIDVPDVVDVKCYTLSKTFFTWLNRRKLYYSVFGHSTSMLHLVLC